MSNPTDPSLEARVARLERLVEELLQAHAPAAAPTASGRHPERGLDTAPAIAPLGSPGEAAAAPASGAAGAGAAAPVRPPRPRWTSLSPAQWAERGENLLGKAGVALLFLGLAFLFEYSVRRGWITPEIRVLAGFVLAAAMLGLGLRLRESRRTYSQILLGGAIAIFYIVGYATHALYHFVGLTTAGAYMTAVTALAFLLAYRQDGSALAVIGAAGGLGTPAVLDTTHPDLVALVVYTCMLLAWTAWLRLRKGWRDLLWTTALGGMAVLLAAQDRATTLPEKWAVQAGLVYAGLLFGLGPLVRLVLAARGRVPARRTPYALVAWAETHALALAVPSIVILATSELWSLGDATVGLLFAAAAAAFVALSRWARTVPEVTVAAARVASVLVVFGTIAALGDAWLLAALAVEGLAAHLLAARWKAPRFDLLGHALFLWTALWSFAELVTSRAGAPSIDGWVAAGLAVAVLMLGASFVLESPRAKVVYRLSVHVLILAWLYRVFSVRPNGTGLVTVAWGAYGAALLIAAIRRAHAGLRQLALATLALTAGKLVLVDTAQVDPLWRILLFLGFGGAFLALSYYFRAAGEADEAAAVAEENVAAPPVG